MFYLSNVQLLYGWQPFVKRTTDYYPHTNLINGDNPNCSGAYKFGYFIKLLNLTQSGRNDLMKDGSIAFNNTYSSILTCDSLDKINTYIHNSAGFGKFVAEVPGVYPSYGMQIRSQFELGMPAATIPNGNLQNDPGWFEVGNWGYNDASIFANRVILTVPADIEPQNTVLGPFTHYMLYKRAVIDVGGEYLIGNPTNDYFSLPICIWKIDSGSFNWNITDWNTGAGSDAGADNTCVRMVAGDQFYIKFGGDGPSSANYNGVVLGLDNDPYAAG